MILTSIKESTREFHQEIEELAYSNKITDNSLSLEEYKRILVVNYIFNKNLENKILENNDIKLIEELDFYSRLKSSLIEEDLRNVGIDPKEVFKAIDLSHISDLYSSLGYLYLSEGSTLGGNVICKKLKENENLKNIDKFNFYGCYGDNIGPKWKIFCQVMAKEVNEVNEDKVINSAHKAFNNYIIIFKSVANFSL
ncbi:MAG: biliverdin-producing heme oxygenase [Candidatus Sericytochromatia bacterium]|nr:biliverdin-producing heme oxygenase [Candidatus Sericytochromatia bacterium]